MRSGGHQTDGNPVHIRKGQEHALFLLAGTTKAQQIVLTDAAGHPAAQTTVARFEPIGEFPSQPGTKAEINSILFVDNQAQPPHPLNVIAAGADAPASLALKFRIISIRACAISRSRSTRRRPFRRRPAQPSSGCGATAPATL